MAKTQRVPAERLRLNATAGTVLGFLLERPMSGYELSREISETVGNFWNVTQSQIYREIQSLESTGLIKAGERAARATRYRITPAGKEAFSEWVHREPGATLIRDPFLLKVFFADRIDRATLGRFIRQRRSLHENRLAHFRAVDKRAPANVPKRTLAFGIRFEEAMLAWLDSLKI